MFSGTLALAYVSRASLNAPRSHGFYRFWAWEAILGLVLLNLQDWFSNPFSWYQIISWILLIIGLGLVIEGVRLLRNMGKQDSSRVDSPMLGFEKTTALVTHGLYGYIRHPLYSSLLFLAWGVFFKIPSGWGTVLMLIATACLVATARTEEVEDIRYFGQAYRDYIQETRMFIPYIF